MLFGNIQSQSRQQNSRSSVLAVVLGALLGAFCPPRGELLAAPGPGAAVDPAARELIPYEKFTLGNGLTVVVHTDRKAPIVAVNVWYLSLIHI